MGFFPTAISGIFTFCFGWTENHVVKQCLWFNNSVPITGEEEEEEEQELKEAEEPEEEKKDNDRWRS